MFTIKARDYDGKGSCRTRIFEAETFEIHQLMLDGAAKVVVSCYGTSIDSTQSGEFDGQDFAHLTVVPSDQHTPAPSDDPTERLFHEVFIENSMGKTTEVVRHPDSE